MKLEPGYFRAIGISHRRENDDGDYSAKFSPDFVNEPTLLTQADSLDIYWGHIKATAASGNDLNNEVLIVRAKMLTPHNSDRIATWLLARERSTLRSWHESITNRLPDDKLLYYHVPLPKLSVSLHDQVDVPPLLRASAMTLRLEGNMEVASVTLYAKEGLSVERTELYKYLVRPYETTPVKSCRLVSTKQGKPAALYLDSHGNYTFYIDSKGECFLNVSEAFQYLHEKQLLPVTSDVPATVRISIRNGPRNSTDPRATLMGGNNANNADGVGL